MKLYQVFLIVVITFQNLNAQKKTPAYVGISIGPVFPTGKFSSSDTQVNKAGFAKIGFLYEGNFSFLFNQYLGMTGLLRGQIVPTRAENIAAPLIASYPQISWTVKSGSWNTGFYFLGPHLSLPLSEAIFLDLRALVGITQTSSPELNLTGRYNQEEIRVKQESKKSVGFGALAGLGIRFGIGEKLWFLLSGDFSSTAPAFTDVKISGSDGKTEKTEFSQSINTLNARFGIGFNIR